MRPKVSVTIDTNMLDEAEIGRVTAVAEAHGLDIDVRTTTVNVRERGSSAPITAAIAEPLVWGESRWGEGAWGDSRTVRELLILDETPLDVGVLAGLQDLTRFEAILKVISNGSFPPPGARETLTEKQRRQLRDAMTLEAHARDRGDVFVTGDLRGFVRHGRREALEHLCSTRIVTSAEVGAGWP